MRRSWKLLLVLGLSAASTSARADSTPSELAARAWEAADAVLARHVDPPTRQTMFLAGLKAMVERGQAPAPFALARRVSGLKSPDDLAPIVAEVLGSSRIPDGPDGRSKLEAAFYEGLLAPVPHGAQLLSAKERRVAEQVDGNVYVGIQVALSLDEALKRPKFEIILEGGPADEAGVKAGDVIEAIDGVSTEGKPMMDTIDRLRGEEGTVVLVRVRRPSTGETSDKPMNRGRLPRVTVEGVSPLPDKRWRTRLDGADPIAYFRVKEISGSTPQELRALAEAAESEGARSVILDLREVQQSSFHAALLLADALLDGGTIGRVRSTQGVRDYPASPDALFRGWPMAVLVVNSKSRPATWEPATAWLVEALRDNRHASVVGDVALQTDPVVEEYVSLPGGEWSIKMATGILEHADGRPLAVVPPRGLIPKGGRIIDRASPPSDPNSNYLFVPAPDAAAAKNPAGPDADQPRPATAVNRTADPIAEARTILSKALRDSR